LARFTNKQPTVERDRDGQHGRCRAMTRGALCSRGIRAREGNDSSRGSATESESDATLVDVKLEIREAIDTYVAAWNETDPARRAALIERCCSDELRIVAPGMVVRGRAELDALIADFHRRRPGDRGRLSSELDVHGGVFRFAAMIEGSTVAAPVEMLDVGECDDHGRIRLIFSFVGAAPPGKSSE
jgi:hypothetical protein